MNNKLISLFHTEAEFSKLSSPTDILFIFLPFPNTFFGYPLILLSAILRFSFAFPRYPQASTIQRKKSFFVCRLVKNFTNPVNPSRSLPPPLHPLLVRRNNAGERWDDMRRLPNTLMWKATNFGILGKAYMGRLLEQHHGWLELRTKLERGKVPGRNIAGAFTITAVTNDLVENPFARKRRH